RAGAALEWGQGDTTATPRSESKRSALPGSAPPVDPRTACPVVVFRWWALAATSVGNALLCKEGGSAWLVSQRLFSVGSMTARRTLRPTTTFSRTFTTKT